VRIQACVVAGDVPVALQPSDALAARGCRQSDALGEFGVRDAALLLQGAQDPAVDAVEVPDDLRPGSHRGSRADLGKIISCNTVMIQ
jgi:hypothetical protein